MDLIILKEKTQIYFVFKKQNVQKRKSLKNVNSKVITTTGTVLRLMVIQDVVCIARKNQSLSPKESVKFG